MTLQGLNKPHVCYIRHQRVWLPIHRMMMAQNMYSKTLQWHSLYCFYYWCFWVQNSDRMLIAKYIPLYTFFNKWESTAYTDEYNHNESSLLIPDLSLHCMIHLHIKTCLNIWPQVMNEPKILSFLGRYSTSLWLRCMVWPACQSILLILGGRTCLRQKGST